MSYTACAEYYYLYKQFKRHNYGLHHNNRIKDEIERLTKQDPSIITSCKIWQKVRCGRNIQLSETQKVFKYNHCIDVTDLKDIDTRINATVSLLIKLKVEFADPDTEHLYKEHVEQLSTQVFSKNCENNVEMTTDTFYRVSSFTNEIKIDYRENINYYQGLHWSLKILILLNENFWYKFQTITIKKIVSTQDEEIL